MEARKLASIFRWPRLPEPFAEPAGAEGNAQPFQIWACAALGGEGNDGKLIKIRSSAMASGLARPSKA